MSVKICQHVKVDGTLCQVPPLDGRHYCHFHLDNLGRRLRMARARARREPYHLVLPILEDLNAVQVARQQVMDALASGQLDTKRAGQLLFGLQGAANDLRSAAPPRLGVYDPAIDTAPRATEYPDFEEKFGLPPDIDLSKPPEVVFPPAVEPAITQAGPSPYRSELYEHDYVAPEDVELEEIFKSQGEEAYRRREKELTALAIKQVLAHKREVQRARYVVEAARRNEERILGTPEQRARDKAEVEREKAEAAACFKAQKEAEAAAAEAGKKPPATASGEGADLEAAHKEEIARALAKLEQRLRARG
jgi:hypothetical protein